MASDMVPDSTGEGLLPSQPRPFPLRSSSISRHGHDLGTRGPPKEWPDGPIQTPQTCRLLRRPHLSSVGPPTRLCRRLRVPAQTPPVRDGPPRVGGSRGPGTQRSLTHPVGTGRADTGRRGPDPDPEDPSSPTPGPSTSCPTSVEPSGHPPDVGTPRNSRTPTQS